MNVKVRTIGGGIFSKFMVGIQSIEDKIKKPIDNIYIDINWGKVDKSRQIKTNINPFDLVLDQDNTLEYTTIDGNVSHLHSQMLNSNAPYKFVNVSNLTKKIKYKESILNKINPDIDENTIGVHVRLTDMNQIHKGKNRKLTTEDYLKTIEQIVNNTKKTKLFISSDNEESIIKIKENFDVICNNVNNRSQTEVNVDYNQFLRDNSNSQEFWEDSFLDMISLSKCSELIHTYSNFSLASIMISNTIKNTYKI